MLRPVIAVVALLLLVGAGTGAFLVLAHPGGPSDPISRAAAPFSYDLVGWELRHVLNRWLYQVAHLFDDEPSTEEENVTLRRYFALASEVASLQPQVTAGGDEALRLALDEKLGQQRRLENQVEAIMEKRLSQVLRDEGLTTSLPLFSRVRFVFPPVDFELDQPPRMLVISPRGRIAIQRTILLRSGLTADQVTALEEETAVTGVSSLVDDIGGLGTYPTTVSQSGHSRYQTLVETVAHEWLHNYLAFHPLGRHYFGSPTLRTLNETVASIADREIAGLVRQRFPLPGSDAAPADGQQETPKMDFKKEMRALRLEVDRLLGEGKIDEAEALMEDRRKFLAENGYYIRKINQAYFAVRGLYGDNPESTSSIGPKLREMRRLSPSLAEFIRTVAQITSEADLDRLLAEKAQAPSPGLPAGRQAQGRFSLHLDLGAALGSRPLLLLQAADGRIHQPPQRQQKLLAGRHQVLCHLRRNQIDDGTSKPQHQLLPRLVLTLEGPRALSLGHDPHPSVGKERKDTSLLILPPFARREPPAAL